MGNNKLKSLLACATIALVSGQAAAATVGATITYDTLGFPNTSWLAPATVTASGSNSVALTDLDLPPIAGPGYDLYHHTFMDASATANVSGDIFASTQLRVAGRLDAVSTWSDTFANASGVQQNYGFNVNIDQMRFDAQKYGSYSGTQDYRAGFSAAVLVNGVEVWNTSQIFSFDGTNAGLTTSGVDIGTGTVNNDSATHSYTAFSYDSTPYSGIVDLGSFAAGQTFDVSYVFSSFAYWNDPVGCAYECGLIGSIARDPFGLNGDPVVVLASNPSVTAVPEPQTYALLLAGLGLLGALARRRSRHF